MLRGKTIVLGVAGGIAAFKAASVASALTKKGADVHVIMTESAQKFIAPLTFQSLTKNPVYTDTFTEPDPSELAHIALADKADLILVAPATANLIGKVAGGIADDMLTTTIMATQAPVMFALAMNVNMLNNKIVQSNLTSLSDLGYRFVDSNEGYLACGWTGKGRLAEPDEIVARAEELFAGGKIPKDLAGLRVMISAGGNVEPLDPVRLITNRSTGKMGYALAEAAVARGARVVLITGPTQLPPIPGVEKTIEVETGLDMHREVLGRLPEMDVFISAAAVSDYRPKEVLAHKLKKQEGPLLIEFVRNPDILKEAGERKREDQVVVGFAAETENVLENARAKLLRKNADLFVANDVSRKDAGFGADTNVVTIIGRDGGEEELPLMKKIEVAHRILHRIADLRRERA